MPKNFHEPIRISTAMAVPDWPSQGTGRSISPSRSSTPFTRASSLPKINFIIMPTVEVVVTTGRK
ncbi:hypothetical protein D3C76_1504000 [compost metagenome]